MLRRVVEVGGEAGVTDQPAGAVTPIARSLAVATPSLATVTVAVTLCPAPTAPGRPDSERVRSGATLLAPCADTSYMTTPWAGTVAAMVPAVSVALLVQRLSSR